MLSIIKLPLASAFRTILLTVEPRGLARMFDGLTGNRSSGEEKILQCQIVFTFHDQTIYEVEFVVARD
jgi:hypothetical protein